MTGIRLFIANVLATSAMVVVGCTVCHEAGAQSLVHQWSFENDYLDTSGSGNHGTPSGAPSFAGGKFGQAVSLNSGADGVHLDFFAENLPLAATDLWSMNVWLNLATPPANLEHIAGFSLDNGFISTGGADNGRARSFISQTVAGNVNYYFWGGNADRASGVGYDADSQWHMYTISYDGTNINMYKDAVLVISAPPAPNAFQLAYDEVHVGNPSQWLPDAFTGIVDEFTIFNGALSDGQVGGLLYNNDINQPVFLDPSFTVDRDSGEIVLTNDSSFDIDVLGYTIKSTSGSLQPMDWDTIAGRFDDAGDGSIDDNDNWTVLTNTSESFSIELSEGVPGTDGGTIDIGKVINFGPSWAENPIEDITIELLLNDGLGTIKTLSAEFSGNGGDPFAVGDFDADGDVDVVDWQYFRTRSAASLAGTTQTEAYLNGDLDGDDDKDIDDFDLFVDAFDDANGGAGAFQAMLTGVPEPGSIWLIAVAGFGALLIPRRKCRLVMTVVAATVIVGAGATSNPVHAALNGYYQLNGNANEDTGININLSLLGDTDFIGSVHPGLGVALSLDGDGDGAIGANYNKIQTSDVTVVAWVYATSLDGTWDTIVKQWGDVRGQFHFGLGGGTPAGTLNLLQNEYGRTAGASTALTTTTPDPFPTNEWVHVAFTLDSVNGFHRLYVNGDVVASAAYPGPGLLGNKTTGGNPTGLGIGVKPNTAGTAASNVPGVWNGYIDEVAIYDHALQESDIEQIIANSQAGIQIDGTTAPYIRLVADHESGEVTLINDSPGGVDISAYQVSSPSGRLQPADWDDLAGNAGFPVGNGTGNGWEKDAASNSMQLLETYFAGASNFSNGLDIPLGDIFAGGIEDLELYYRTADGYIVKSIVEYTGTAVSPGDYNLDGIVDAADYVVWRKTNGSNPAGYQTWRTNFGEPSGGGSFAAAANSTVPEPAALTILFAVVATFSLRRHR